MPDAVPIVLWSWVPITMALFWKLPPARAALGCLLGGWLILPTARFADDLAGVAFPYWIMPACLPADQWTTKARIIGLSGLLGVMAFDPGVWRKFRPKVHDVPMLGWCLVPIASGLFNGLGPAASLANAAYLAESWGVPYLLGRLYFGDPAGLALLARGVVGGGLAYAPICLVEFATGPRVYEMAYGFQPFRTIGMARYLGYRPIGFLEDGNQLGIWMASAAMVATWLWRSGQLARFGKIPGWMVAGLLVGLSILTQSAGAVALLVAGLAIIEAVRWDDRTWPIVAVGALLLAFVGARAANLFDAKALAMRTSVGRKLVDASVRLDRGSFGWRLRVEERAARLAIRRPLLGWGRWDWWRDATPGERPWGLFSLVLGMGGLLGWSLLIGIFGFPLSAFLNLGPPRFWTMPNRAPAAAMAGLLALNLADAVLNSAFLLPFLAAAGGMVGMKSHAEAASEWLRRAQAGDGRATPPPREARR